MSAETKSTSTSTRWIFRRREEKSDKIVIPLTTSSSDAGKRESVEKTSMEKEGSFDGETASEGGEKPTFLEDDDHAIEQRDHALDAGNAVDVVCDHVQRVDVDKTVDPTRV